MSLTPTFLKKALLAGLLVLTGVTVSQAQTWYSRQSGNMNATTTWTNSASHIGGTSPTGAQLSLLTNNFVIGSNHAITIQLGSPTINAVDVTVGDGSGTGTLQFGNNNNDTPATTLNITGDLLVNANGTVRVSGNGGATHQITLTGDLTNLGSLALRNASGDMAELTFKGAGSKIIATGATSTFATIDVDLLASAFITDAGSNAVTTILVNGTLTTAATGTFSVNGNGGGTHQMNITGNIVNNGTFDMVGDNGDVANVSFTGTTQTVSVKGQTFNNVTNTTGTTNFTTTSGTLAVENLTVSSGTVTIGNLAGNNTAFDLDLHGDVVVGGTLYIRNAGNGTMNAAVAGNITNNSTLAIGNTGSNTTVASVGGTITNNSGDSFTVGNSGVGGVTFTTTGAITNAGTFTIGNTGTGAMTANLNGTIANTASIFTIGNAANSAMTATVSGDINITGGSFLLGGNGGTAGTFNLLGDVTNSATFTAGGNGGATHLLNLAGNVTNNSTFNATGAGGDILNVSFTGATLKTFGGSGSATFQSLTMNTSGNANVNLNQSITVNGVLGFSANGLLVVGTDYNITMSRTASFGTGGNAPSVSRYIQLDGGTGANSSLIVVYNSTTPNWIGTYPIGTTTGGYSRMVINTLTTAPTNNATLTVKGIFNASIQGQLRRTFRLTVAGNSANTNFDANFYYNTVADVSGGDALNNYTNIWYLNSGFGNWTSLGGEAPPSVTGYFSPTAVQTLGNGIFYFTLGATTAYPNTWYSYQTGAWSNWENWTLDPSGTTLVNGLNLPPQPGDAVVILNGFTITNDGNGKVVSNTIIEGGATLDMVATTGNTLGVVSGGGTLRVKGVVPPANNVVDLPSGNYAAFVTTGTGGTMEYYDLPVASATLPTGQTTYNKLILSNSTGSNITYVLASDLTANSDLNITQLSGGGTVTLQINNGTAAHRVINLNEDLIVSARGQIRVSNSGAAGNGVTSHEVNMYGNIVNNGSIKFYDTADGQLNEANYVVGNAMFRTNAVKTNAVRVTFRAVTEQTVTCNGQTDFYQLFVNKGTGVQSMLTITSAAVANFRIFGPTNLDNAVAGVASFPLSALSIQNGTLQLRGFMNIPSLVEGNASTGIGNGWAIPQSAALWVNSPNITITVTSQSTAWGTPPGDNGRQIYVYGQLRLTDGTINMGYSRGLLGGGSGLFLIEGGTLNTWQLRTTYLGGAGNRFAYKQTGGTVNVGGGTTSGTGVLQTTGPEVNTYSRFALPYAECSFEMSNGTINVAQPTPDDNSVNGGIIISAATQNIKVTGGTVNAILPASGVNFIINSTAPFYNLKIIKNTSGGSTAILAGIAFNDGNGATNTNTNRAIQPLTVLGNLTLESGQASPTSSTLECANQNLTIGGNLSLQAGAILLMSGSSTAATTNTLTFNGAGVQLVTNNGTINQVAYNSNPALLNAVTISKSAGTLTLAGSSAFPGIASGNITTLNLASGTLNDGGKTLNVTTSLTNNAIHTGTGAIVYTGTADILGANGTFGNLTVQTNATVSLAGDQKVTGNLRLTSTNTTLSISKYKLTVLGGIFSDNTNGVAFSATRRIALSGLPNNGGLTRQAVSGDEMLFPVGIATTGVTYTPITINVTATTAGLINVIPVNGSHPNVTTVGRAVRYYWKVSSTGFVGLGNVIHKAYTYAGAARDYITTDANYVPARYDGATFQWATGTSYSAANATPGATTIPEFNTATFASLMASKLDGEYTAGNISAFQAVSVFYSSATPANWGTAASWSNTAVGATGGAGIPCATCPVVIGAPGFNHTIINNADGQSAGSLQIAEGSTLDCNTRINLNFGVNNRGVVSGRGKIRISSGVFPQGDFSEFIGPNGGTVEWYGAMTTIPATGSGTPALALISYYNLIVSPNAGVTMNLPQLPNPVRNLTVYNDMTVSGGSNTATVRTATDAARNIAINGNLLVSGGSLTIMGDQLVNLLVGGNTTINANAALTVNAAGATRTHTLTAGGSVVNNGTLRLRSGSELINATFTGTGNHVLTTSAGATTTLNTIVINKGADATSTLTVEGAGTMDVLTNGWLTLTNGTIAFNFTGTAGATTPGTFTLLSTTTSAYSIGATSKLKVQAGVVNITTASNNNADLALAGGVEVAGGTLNVGSAANTTVNNDIEYAAAGLPAITVSGGTLNVYGSIRRPATTLSGALVYNQSGGTVIVSGTASNNTRGVFEIENNAGSVFNLSGNALLQIQRTTGGAAFADLYVNPSSSTVSATSTIEMGLGTGNQSMSYNVGVPIGNYTIAAGTGTQSVMMYSNPMIASGNILINTNRTLNTNALDVFVGGNLTIDGTYNGAANTTTFNGSGAQAGKLSSNSSFLNMTVNKSAGTVLLSGTAPTLNNLNILNGTLDVGAMSLAVNRDITNNSFQVGTGNVTLAGTATTHSIYSNNGSFTNLTLGATTVQAPTKVVTVFGNMSIQGTLNFSTTSRYLYIKSSRLTFDAGASVSGAGPTAFIRTNGVSSDLGVVKIWPTGVQTFTYAVGTRFNYTPVFMDLDVSASGSYTIIPVDDQHPTADAMGEVILNYYWMAIKDASLAYSATGTHSYRYPKSLIGGSGGTYTGAYLDAINLIGWTTTPPTATFPDAVGDNTSSVMTFAGSVNASTPANGGGEFHYTAGTPGTGHTLPNPIQAVYSRFSDADNSNTTTVGATGGNWNLATNWTLATDGKGLGLSTIPVGRPIVILPNAKIYMNIAGLRAFKSIINGTLIVTNQSNIATTGHNLGTMSGTGTLQVKSSTLPAGNYTDFVSAAGGTIEYNGTMAMNNRSTYNHVSIIGGGVVTMTNTDLVLNGNVTIATGSKLDNSPNNRTMAVAKNFTTQGTGIFDPGLGSVKFTGNTTSIITGNNSTFYGLEVAKTGAGTVSPANPVTVNGNLTMTTGTYESTVANLLTVSATGTTSGGSSASFVVGPMRKELLAGDNFAFPIGNTTDSRYRPAGIYSPTADDFWTIEYIGNNPTDDGFNCKAFNSNAVKKVSMFEYWLVSPAGTTMADLELSYSTGSYIPNTTNVGNVSNLRVVHWDAGNSQWDFPSGGGSFSQAGSNVTGTVRVTGVDSFSPFTLGSLDFDSPLPVKWGPVDANWVSTAVEVKWVTLQEQNNDHFEVQRSEDGVSFVSIGTIAGAGNTSDQQTYRFKDNNASMARRYYYRIGQVDYNGLSDYSPLAVVMPLDGNERQKSWLAYPNPIAKDVDFVLYRSDEVVPQQVQVGLYSSQGILIYQASGSLQDMNTAVSKYLQSVHSGVYMLQVSDGTLSQGFKIVRP